MAHVRSINSKLVRLEASHISPTMFGTNGFNSKLVRLEDTRFKERYPTLAEFQFQTGAIRSFFIVRVSVKIFVFQFQTGAIRSEYLGQNGPTENIGFQFQTGAIRSRARDITPVLIHKVSIPNWCD